MREQKKFKKIVEWEIDCIAKKNIMYNFILSIIFIICLVIWNHIIFKLFVILTIISHLFYHFVFVRKVYWEEIK